jgi:membrane protein YqaA with SNARE-associated domain
VIVHTARASLVVATVDVPLVWKNDTMIRSWSKWLIALFTSPLGVVVLAALDSTLFFSLPFGIDAAVIILAARRHALAWLVPLLATCGSIAGAALTFWMGAKIGENGLERYVSPGRLERVHAKVSRSGAVALAVLDLIPPPFPFTPFVLAAGALEVKASMFFVTLAVCRLARFGLEAALAVLYGRQIVAWLDSELFHDIVFGCVALAAALTVWSIVRLVRSTRPRGRRPAAA